MSDQSYNDIQAINASAIVAGTVSMLHMREEMCGRPKADTTAMRWGRMVHAAVLEPDEYLPTLRVWDGPVKRGKRWDEFSEDIDPDAIVTPDQMRDLMEMSARLHSNEVAHEWVERSKHEVAATWEDQFYGAGKCRFDGQSPRWILEYKTTGNIVKEAFFRTAYRLKYHIKFGWYAHGFEKVYGCRPTFYVICQQAKPPFDVRCFDVAPGILDKGEEEAVTIARAYHVAEVCGSFPGVSDGIEPFELPRWAMEADGAWTVGEDNEGEGEA